MCVRESICYPRMPLGRSVNLSDTGMLIDLGISRCFFLSAPERYRDIDTEYTVSAGDYFKALFNMNNDLSKMFYHNMA